MVIVDQAGELESVGGERDRRPSAAEHGGEKLLGELQGVAPGAVGGDQKPAGHALIHAVFYTAACGLRQLCELHLHVAETEVLELTTEAELLPGVLDRTGKATSLDLHIDPVEAVFGPHQTGDADDGLIAEHGDLCLGAIQEGGGHGADAFLDEEEISDWPPDLFQGTSDGQGYGRQVKVLYDGGREMAQNRVFKAGRIEIVREVLHAKGTLCLWDEYALRGKCRCQEGSAAPKATWIEVCPHYTRLQA